MSNPSKEEEEEEEKEEGDKGGKGQVTESDPNQGKAETELLY